MSEDLGPARLGRARLGPQPSGPPGDIPTGPADPATGDTSPEQPHGRTADAGQPPGAPRGAPPGADAGEDTTGWSPPGAEPPPPTGRLGWAAPAGAAGAGAAATPGGLGVAAATARQGPVLGRPGGIPLRPMDVGDILDGAFGTIRRNPRTVLGLAALLVTTQEVLSVGAAVATGDVPTAIGAFSLTASLQVVGGIGAVAGLVLSALTSALLTGVMAVVVSEEMFGRRTGSGAVWGRMRPRLAALAAGSLIAGLAPFAGLLFLAVPFAGPLLALLLLVVPGGLLWGAWALTTPALILEHLGPLRALRRSWRLGFPSFWRVWGIRALAVLLAAVMQSLLLIPFATLGTVLAVGLGSGADDPLPLIALAFVVLGRILGGIIAEPFLAGVLALLYVDRRMRAEGLDIVLQQRDRAARQTTSSAAGRAGAARGGGAVALGGIAP